MPLLVATGIRKSYREDPILDGVSLTLEPGRRYGLVGPNGCGKSTLAKILVGELAPESGSVSITRDARVVHLPQRPDLVPGHTVRREVMRAFDDLVEMEERLRELEEEMARKDRPEAEVARAVERHGRLMEEFQRRGGWDRERLVERALAGLGVPEEVRDQDVATLSGGQATRVSLARALLGRPDLLILDEPTNHLDLDATEWLEAELCSRSGAVLVISHDRWFLDRVAESIVEIERTKARVYPGNYSKFERLREARRAEEAAAYARQREHIEKEEDFIRRNVAAQRVAMAKGKRKRLRRLERLDAPTKDGKKMAIPTAADQLHVGEVLTLTDVSVSLGGKRILDRVSLRVGTGTVAGIVGPNGAGKTTLVRAIMGEIDPDGGRIEKGHRARFGFLAQEPERPRPGVTVLETMQAAMPLALRQEVRDWLGRFLFSGDDVEKKAEELSGGEASRLALALMFLEKPNVLILDEPTNHLDIPGREALEAAILTFPGTVLLVSHDRFLLQSVADRIVEIRPGEVTTTEGGWADHARRREADSTEAKKAGKVREKTSKPKAEKPDSGKVRNPYRFAKLEESIMEHEERIAAIQAEMLTEAAWRDAAKFKALQAELRE
ncbi:MAG: ribosomal protection-like ABC-F family protein, partial [Planctomycetota bacterium]